MARTTRRRVLGATAGLFGASAVAGCTADGGVDGGGGSGDGASAAASFFVFGDFASHVAGEVGTAETLVPVGQHGHGWEPGPRIRARVLESDLFVYVVEGFQPWVDDLVRDVREDGADVTTIAAGDGVDPIGVSDERDGHDEDGHEGDSLGDHGEDDHDHGGADPHFWLDPLRARRAVVNLRDGFVAVDGDNEETYVENAEAYRARLDELHESISTALDGRTKDVILVAGHNSVRHLGSRYGFRVEALTELSPDERTTPRDIERAQMRIREHDIEYVLADPLEPQTAADQLVAETDATEVLPITAIPGRTNEWADEGWGYVEIMEQINLPTLERALGVT